MKKKALTPILLASFALGFLISCQGGSSSSVSSQGSSSSSSEEAAADYAYCTQNYNAGSGHFGRFDLSLGEGYSFTDLNDLSSLTLSEAFAGMSIHSAVLSEEDETTAIFFVTGALNEGDYGLISGTGLVEGQDVSIVVLIDEASAATSDVIYNGAGEKTLTIDLTNACFDSESLALSDFSLSGSLEGMSVKGFSVADPVYEEEGDEYPVLPNAISLTLTGEPDIYDDTGYVTIASKATTYKDDLLCVVDTAYRGGTIVNEYIDTYTLEESVFVEANNLHFVEGIDADDITLGGAFEGYASIKEVSVITETLVSITLSFPYTFLDGGDALGSIAFSASTNEEAVAFTSYGYLETPEINFSLTQEERHITLDFTLAHEEFNLLDTYPFSLYKADGSEVLVSELETVNIDSNLRISFLLPEDAPGFYSFVLEDAYDVVNQEGQTVNVTIKMSFYLD